MRAILPEVPAYSFGDAGEIENVLLLVDVLEELFEHLTHAFHRMHWITQFSVELYHVEGD